MPRSFASDSACIRAARGIFSTPWSRLACSARTDGRYSNTPETDLFLDPAKPSYMGGMLEMANARLYHFWGSLTEGLRTGQPQSEVKTGGDFFETLYADPEKLAQFAGAMSGLSRATGQAIAAKFPWRDYSSVIDIGCAQGAVPVAIATAHDHLTGGGFDLPPVEPIFNAYVAQFGLADRLNFTPGDFFADPLPSADVLVMGHILHDWDLDQKRLLLQKAYAALPKGGALIVYEAIIDDDRRENAFGLLMSLNMLVEGLGFDLHGRQTAAAGWPRRASAKATSNTWSALTRWWSGSSKPSRGGSTPAPRRSATPAAAGLVRHHRPRMAGADCGSAAVCGALFLAQRVYRTTDRRHRGSNPMPRRCGRTPASVMNAVRRPQLPNGGCASRTPPRRG